MFNAKDTIKNEFTFTQARDAHRIHVSRIPLKTKEAIFERDEFGNASNEKHISVK